MDNIRYSILQCGLTDKQIDRICDFILSNEVLPKKFPAVVRKYFALYHCLSISDLTQHYWDNERKCMSRISICRLTNEN